MVSMVRLFKGIFPVLHSKFRATTKNTVNSAFNKNELNATVIYGRIFFKYEISVLFNSAITGIIHNDNRFNQCSLKKKNS